MDLQLRGRTAIVTGGSRGIGKAIARELAREGVSVAIVARGQAALEATANELRAETDMPIFPIVADTGSNGSVQRMVEQAVDALGSVEILVNSASAVGSTVAFKLPDIPIDAFVEQLNIKVLGYLRVIQHVAPHMIRNGWGRIINISGMNARQTASVIGSSRNVAVVAMAKNVADELGPHGINVITLHPGLTLTEHYLEQVEQSAASRGISREEVIRERFATNVLGRPITPTDIAHVVTFLASPRAVAINGEAISVAGGMPGAIHY